MPHYRDGSGELYWFDTDEEKQKFSPLLVATTGLAPTAAELWADFQNAARAELDRVTGPRGTIIRCVVASVAIPVAWQTYIADLRAIVAATTGTPGTLPAAPAYPAGT